MTTHNSEVITEGLKAAPAVTVGSLTLFGVGLSDWVLLATMLYTVMQMYFLIRDKWYRPRKGKSGSKR